MGASLLIRHPSGVTRNLFQRSDGIVTLAPGGTRAGLRRTHLREPRPLSRSRTWTLVCFGVALAALGSCAQGDDSGTADRGAPADLQAPTTAAGAEPGILLTVTGSVGLVFGDHAFEVGVREGDAVLVVLLERPFPTQRGVSVRVTGVVEPLRVRVLEARGLRDEAARLAPLEGRDALMASVVETPDGGGS